LWTKLQEFRTKQIVEGNTSTAWIMGESLLQESLLQVLHSDGILSCHSQTIPHNSLGHVAEGNNFGRSSSHSLCSSRITAQEKKLKNKSSHTLLLMQEQSSLECLFNRSPTIPPRDWSLTMPNRNWYKDLLCGTNLQMSFALLQVGQTCDEMECPCTNK
jgi:hypothetical protein